MCIQRSHASRSMKPILNGTCRIRRRGVSTLIRVGSRAAPPVLLEEHPQTDFRVVEFVGRIEREQHLVLAHQLVETGHDLAERFMAAHGVVERLRIFGHPPTIVYIRLRASPRHPMFTDLTCEHGQNCRADAADPWWTGCRRTHVAAQTEPRSPRRGGPDRVRSRFQPARRPSHSWPGRRISVGGTSPGVVTELNLRTAHGAPPCAGR